MKTLRNVHIERSHHVYTCTYDDVTYRFALFVSGSGRKTIDLRSLEVLEKGPLPTTVDWQKLSVLSQDPRVDALLEAITEHFEIGDRSSGQPSPLKEETP